MNLTFFLPLIVVWLVPWGYLNLSYTVPHYFAVGVVVPYCVDDGYVPEHWAQWCIEVTNHYYERGYIVFVKQTLKETSLRGYLIRKVSGLTIETNIESTTLRASPYVSDVG